jgi:putative ABC transport system permease protein
VAARAVIVYRLLLHAFPASFRDRFARDMTDVFADRLRGARAVGVVAVVTLWTLTTVDVVRHGFAERRADRARVRLATHRRAAMWSSIRQDLRYAVRALRQRPAFTSVALVALTLGIGANAAIFSVVHAVLLRPLPYPAPDRIVELYATHRTYHFTHGVMSAFDLDYLQSHTTTFAELSAVNIGGSTLTGVGEPQRLRHAAVMPAFFDVVATRPEIGRAFSVEEATSNARVVVLAHSVWMGRFGGQADVLGRAITLDDRSWTVIGVMPERFAFPEILDVDLLTPFELTAKERQTLGMWFLGVIGRMKPGVSVAAAQAEVDRAYAEIIAAHPKERTNRGVLVEDLQEALADRVASGLRLLQGVVVCVLLVACANVANLLLAQTGARARELAVRAAMGASRARLVRQLLTESVALSLAGAALGILLAIWGVRALVALAPPFLLPPSAAIGVSWPALAFTAGVAVVTGIAFGLVPALLSSRSSPVADLKEGQRAAAVGLSWSRRQGLRAGLVAAEIALALMLVAGAGLLVRSFALLLEQAPGFRTDHLLTAQITLPPVRYDTEASRLQFWTQLMDRLRGMPGATGAAGANALPFSNWEWQADFVVKGRESVKNDGAGVRTVTPGFFDVLGIPVLRGRGLTNADTSGAERVMVVSDAFARDHLPGLDPIGQLISFSSRAPAWARVVGVVGSTRQLSLDETPRADMYLPLSQREGTTTLIVGVRSQGDPAQLAPALRAAVKALDSNLPVQEIRTMEELIGRNVAQRRFYMVLLALFAGLAGVLAIVGTYGVMSYVVTQGRREIGIRLALGARPGQVQRELVARALRVVAVGLAVGLVGAWWGASLLSTQLFQLTPHDPGTLGGVVLLLGAAGALASWIPTRRSSRVDPVIVLRAD